MKSKDRHLVPSVEFGNGDISKEVDGYWADRLHIRLRVRCFVLWGRVQIWARSGLEGGGLILLMPMFLDRVVRLFSSWVVGPRKPSKVKRSTMGLMQQMSDFGWDGHGPPAIFHPQQESFLGLFPRAPL